MERPLYIFIVFFGRTGSGFTISQNLKRKHSLPIFLHSQHTMIIFFNSLYTFSVSSLIQKVRKSSCLGSQDIPSPLAFAEGLFY